jgi:hypothetical protein
MDLSILSGLSDAQILGLTGAAEARAEFIPNRDGKGGYWAIAPIERMMAVMCTPINRVTANPLRFGKTVAQACLANQQYSCWNESTTDKNHLWLIEQVQAVATPGKYVAPIVQRCIAAAEKLLNGSVKDSVNGATHYYAPPSMIPPGRVPSWAINKTPCATSGNHLFFKGV